MTKTTDGVVRSGDGSLDHAHYAARARDLRSQAQRTTLADFLERIARLASAALRGAAALVSR